MVIVAGHLLVEPDTRDRYLAECVDVVEQGRSSAGCLDYALTADLVDPRRINVFERWESQAALEAFRGSGTGDEQGAMIVSAAVAEYDVAAIRPLS